MKYGGTMRTLASIVKIQNVIKHPNADSLDICTVGGWKVVTKLDEFKQDDLAVYFEIDSWIPKTIAPFLCKYDKEFNGIVGSRLTTVRLRGELSQGLLLPLSIINSSESLPEGYDVTEILGVQKYEKPLPACLCGMAKGNFPTFIPKTDLTRIQSLTKELESWKDHTWLIEEKIDGSSTTAFLNKDEHDLNINVCSRNLNLKESEGNSYWLIARKYDIEQKLKEYEAQNNIRIALQWETFGNGINGNLYKMNNIDGMFFDVYFIDEKRYAIPHERDIIFKQLGVNQVPVIEKGYKITGDVFSLLEMADGKSIVNPNVYREGLVFRSEQDSSVRFKVISNKFLLKYEQ